MDIGTSLGIAILTSLAGVTVHTIYKPIKQYRDNTKLVINAKEKYNENMPLNELIGFYNIILPASTHCSKKVKAVAREMIDSAEINLAKYVLNELKEKISKVDYNCLKDINPFYLSDTFKKTFAKNVYFKEGYFENGPSLKLNKIIFSSYIDKFDVNEK